MSGIDDLITTVTKYRTEDGQIFDTLAAARTQALSLASGRDYQRLLQAINIADLLDAGDITLAQFNNNRTQLSALLRWLVRKARGSE